MSRKQDKFKEIDEFLGQLEPVIPSSFEEYEKDYKAKAICERLFEKIIEAVVDIAHIIIKELGLPPAIEDTNAFEILAEKRIISRELSERLQDAKSMRNFIIHRYGEINDELVFEAVSKELENDVREFIKCVRKLR